MRKYLRTGSGLFSALMLVCALILLTDAVSYGAGAGKPVAPLVAVKVETVSPQEVKVLTDIGANPLLVDTRDEEAFSKMHVTGAVNVPWKQVIAQPADLPRNRMLVLYCDCSDESTSGDVARQLIRDWGYTQVKVLKSGLDGWICLDYPVEGDASGRNSCR